LLTASIEMADRAGEVLAGDDVSGRIVVIDKAQER
jgi:hypothetical protein